MPTTPSHTLDDLTLQPTTNVQEAGGQTQRVVEYKGDRDIVVEVADTLDIGDDGLTNKTIRWTNGDLAVLVLTYSEQSSSSAGATATRTTWNVSNAQQNIPLERFASRGMSAGDRLNNFLQWRAEKDQDLYSQYKYRDIFGNEQALSGRNKACAEKWASGIEDVLRFYPVVKKVTVYTGGTIQNLGAKIGYIDTPSQFSSLADAWLKVGDDLDVGADGTQTRTESWMGAAAWDEDLYGEDRWEVGVS